jgi:hypothetical protein
MRPDQLAGALNFFWYTNSMLPPGHIAAGFIVAKSLLVFTQAGFDQSQTNTLLFLGAFFSFAPDLDMFYAFVKTRSFTIPGTQINHRAYLTHSPLLWLALGLSIYFFSSDPLIQYTGLLLWLGSWSHFVLDSLKVGVRWLYPFSKKFYALEGPGNQENTPQKSFFAFWWYHFIHIYIKKFTSTFILEIILLLSAGVILLQNS